MSNKIIRNLFFVIALVLLQAVYSDSPEKGVDDLIEVEKQEVLVAPKRPKIALVCGGGGAKGLAHVGVLRELEDAGIHPDLIVGCSSGALIAALYSADPNINRMENLLIKIKSSEFFNFSFLSPRFGFMQTNQMKAFLKRHVKHNTFDELKIPLIVTATDLITGETVEIDKGEIIEGLIASSAVPLLFKPVKFGKRLLVDGGVSNPIPVDVAKKYGAQVIIAVDVGAQLSTYSASHLFGVAKRSLEICYLELAKRVAKDADVIIRMDFKDIGMFSHKKNFQVYDRGRKMTRKAMPQIRECIAKKIQNKNK